MNDAPLKEWPTEIEATVGDASTATVAAAPAAWFPVNDSERADRFAAHVDGSLRYVQKWASWFAWDGTRWMQDEGSDLVSGKAQELPVILRDEGAKIEHIPTCQKAINAACRAGDKSKIDAMIGLALHHPAIATKADVFDCDPLLLGVRNGVVDLRNGTFRPARREDFITKQAGTQFDEGATCPIWTKFLRRMLNENDELIDFIQRAVGYTLTGKTSAQVLFFLYGAGSNGKSTFTATLQNLMGDYGQRAPADLFVADRSGKQPEQAIGGLVGKRMVVGSEIEEAAKMAESRVKDLTGQDRISGRFLYSKPFEFDPTHKLWIFGNHKPEIRGTDHGIWRRMRLVPFTVQIPEEEKDGELPDKLLQELPGILNWAMEGCRRWRKNGLGAPQIITAATNEYRSEEDLLGHFIEASTVPGGRVGKSELYAAYQIWATRSGIRNQMMERKFSKGMKERPGIGDTHSGNAYSWTGLTLIEADSLFRAEPTLKAA